VEEHSRCGGYLRFFQESDTSLALEAGTLQYRMRVQGEIVLPDHERYEYREELESSTRPGEVESNSFSYLTVEGGKTAFVTGKGLEEKLGVRGWIHYTPPAGQSRYFDYPRMIGLVTAMGRNPELLDHQELEGARCAHLAVTLEGREMVESILREDPTLSQKLQNMDLGSLVGDVRLEIWIEEKSGLPLQLYLERDTEWGEGLRNTGTLKFRFRDYLRESPVRIEAPQSFTEAG